MKQLIVDYLPFEIQPHQISEAMKENNGKLVVKGGHADCPRVGPGINNDRIC